MFGVGGCDDEKKRLKDKINKKTRFFYLTFLMKRSLSGNETGICVVHGAVDQGYGK